MPTHSTLWALGSVQCDNGIKVVYFRFTHLLVRSPYMGEVYLYCVVKANEVRVTVGLCVIVC